MLVNDDRLTISYRKLGQIDCFHAHIISIPLSRITPNFLFTACFSKITHLVSYLFKRYAHRGIFFAHWKPRR